MKIRYLSVLALSLTLTLMACSDSSEPPTEQKPTSHVWQSQTDALQEAKVTAEEASRLIQLREEKSRPTD